MNEQLEQLNELFETVVEQNQEQTAEMDQDFEALRDAQLDSQEVFREEIGTIGNQMTPDEGQSLGQLFITEFGEMRDSFTDTLFEAFESFRGFMGDTFGDLAGIFEGQPLLDTLFEWGGWLLAGISSLGIFSGLGTTIAGWFGFQSFSQAIKAGLSKAFSGTVNLLSTLLNIGGWTLGASVLSDLILGEGSTAGLIGTALDKLGVDWVVEQALGLEPGSVELGPLFQRRFEKGAEGLQKALQRGSEFIIRSFTSTFDAVGLNKLFGLKQGELGRMFIKRFNKGISGLQAGVRKLRGQIVSFVKRLYQDPLKTLSGIVQSGINAFNTIVTKLKQLPDQISEQFNNLINSIPGAGFFGGGDTGGQSGGGFDIPYVPGFAEGGVISEPSMGFGLQSGQPFTIAENESELVVPQSQIQPSRESEMNQTPEVNVSADDGPNSIQELQETNQILKQLLKINKQQAQGSRINTGGMDAGESDSVIDYLAKGYI